MSTLGAATSAAITKSLMANFPSQLSERFSLNESEVNEFLRTFLTNQLGKSKKGERTPAPKGSNGKGSLTGYTFFSKMNRSAVREENPDMAFGPIGRELGRRWAALSDEEKADWTTRAQAENLKNGLSTPAARATPAPRAARATASRSTPAATSTPVSSRPTIVRHAANNKYWVLEGTDFAVRSSTDAHVRGCVRGGRVVKLSAAEQQTCRDNGWELAA